MAERNAATVATRQMHYRIGISLGDVIHDEARLYGGGVNIAARLEALAGPRGVCVSGEAYAQVHRKPPLRFIDLSEQDLKNIGAPVRVYRIDLTEFHATSRSGEKAPLALPSNPRSPSSLSPSRNISAHKAARKEVDRVRPNHLRQRSAAKHDSDHEKPVRPLRSPGIAGRNLRGYLPCQVSPHQWRCVPQTALSSRKKVCLQQVLYSITSTARERSVGGMVRLIAFAVFRLMINSNRSSCSTGVSAGSAPFKMRSTYEAARRMLATESKP